MGCLCGVARLVLAGFHSHQPEFLGILLTYIIKYFRDEKILGVETRTKDGLDVAISRADESIEKQYADLVVVVDGAGAELYRRPK